ncbi:polysaccharide deacetylase family protein [Romboutsia sp.]|uniref:polysaccharide deacetylase family protein n=1 Tax=Romboutsia sp. TaxID=1965302 RepID=UPI002BB37E80|nr:polysaccharide deacetylase family protein [Romboutsia sp.]HSQ89745.1 polysaccharide deacetylase family protein [Romboutsia sp.]
MHKKTKKKLNIGIITLGILAANIKIGYSYSYSYNKEKLKNTNISNKNTTQEINNTISENNEKVAYITIDDGPSKYTESIIKILNKYNAKATFFMIDRNMKNYPEQVKNIIENKNTAGFHSVSHDIHKLYENDSSAKEEFDVNRQTFYEITGKKSYVVRLPYGSKPYAPSESYETLVEAGYKLWDWDIDTEDWKFNASQIIENVKGYSKNKNEIVILMHEKKQTVEALDGILKYLVSEGYQLLPIDENQKPQNYWLGNLYE